MKVCYPCIPMTTALLAAINLGPAWAQGLPGNYPAKPVTIFVPFAPGGSAETDTRLYAQKVAEQTGWQVLVDFKTGAGGSLGTAYVARSPADGYTLVQASVGYTAAGAIYKKPLYDPLTDLAPISLTHEQPSILVIPAASPFKTVADYIAFARTNPGKINVATNGNGSISHLAFAWLHNITGTSVTFIPYKGAGDVNLALVGNQVDMGTITIATAAVQARGGKVRLLATATGQRLKQYPDIPTVAETVPGYAWAQWAGYLAPAKTPPAIVNRWSSELQKAVHDPDIAKKLVAVGNIPVGSTPEQFRQQIATEANRWKKLVKDIDFNLED